MRLSSLIHNCREASTYTAVAAWLGLHLVHCTLPVLPLQPVLVWGEAPPQRRQRSAASNQRATQAVRTAILRASRRVPRAKCLTQAIVGCAMLRASGVGATLHLGGRRGTSGRFEAHAWLEVNGAVVLGEDGVFEPFVRSR